MKNEQSKIEQGDLMMKDQTKRGGFTIMRKLLIFIAPLSPVMLITIAMGILGFLAAIFITVLGAVGISTIIGHPIRDLFKGLNLTYILLVSFAIARGVLRYLEQYSGHFIAFRLLAIIRDHVYKALRRLAPAKLDEKTSGELISIITADVEQLEVFYAHTVAPIVIGLLTSAFMAFIIYTLSPLLSLIAVLAYFLVGFLIPYATAKQFREVGRSYRRNVGEINAAFMENLHGMQEILLFGQIGNRQKVVDQKSKKANESVKKLKEHQGKAKALTETAILFMSMIMLFTGIYLTLQGNMTFEEFLISIVCLMSSFGPTVALSNLANNLLQTFASGERVLNLLEEKPLVIDNMEGDIISSPNVSIKNLDFSYSKNGGKVLNRISFDVEANQIIGIVGKSGSGKSSLLKLLMRFYDADEGDIFIDKSSIKNIKTTSLRENIAYMTQSSYLFDQTIEENLRIAKRSASMEEIVEACKKSNIHDFIMTLPKQYQSKVGELGSDVLSGGERQRLGLARAFLHDSKILLLDEPTSNLDSLNEAVILASLKEHSKKKTVVLVSHRKSTLSICDKIYTFEDGRLS